MWRSTSQSGHHFDAVRGAGTAGCPSDGSAGVVLASSLRSLIELGKNGQKPEVRSRWLTILLAVGALLLVLVAGAALANTIGCQAGIECDGTQKADRMTGTNANDVISGFGGKIQDAAKHDLDTIAGGGQNDIIDVREGNSGLNNHDYVDCGKGNHDRVFFDAEDQVRDKES